MPHPNAHLLLRMNGSFGPSLTTNAEKWTATLRFGVIGADINYNASALQTFANASHAAVSTFHSTAGIGSGTTSAFLNVSVARIGTDGLYDPTQQDTIFSVGSGIFGSGTTNSPWSSAYVISLRTANFRGYASNGRWYYPMVAPSIDANTGRVSATMQTARVNAAKTLFDALNTAAGAYAVNARLIISSSTGATAAKVTSIRGDQRLDSIERRENAAPAVWQTATLLP